MVKSKNIDVIETVRLTPDFACKNFEQAFSLDFKTELARWCMVDSVLVKMRCEIHNTVTQLICKYGETNANLSSEEQSSFLGFIC